MLFNTQTAVSIISSNSKNDFKCSSNWIMISIQLYVIITKGIFDLYMYWACNIYLNLAQFNRTNINVSVTLLQQQLEKRFKKQQFAKKVSEKRISKKINAQFALLTFTALAFSCNHVPEMYLLLLWIKLSVAIKSSFDVCVLFLPPSFTLSIQTETKLISKLKTTI